MTDPFFRNTTNPQNTSSTTPGTPVTNYSHIIAQQKEIEDNFSKLKTLFASSGISEEQKTQIKNKLLELKSVYAKNKEILENSGYTPENTGGTPQQVHVNKIDAVEDPKKSKINTNSIMVGCGVIFLFLLGGLAFLFYYMITHPSQLKNIGLAPENVKKLLQTFTTVFFGFIVLLGFVLLIMNFYRVFSSKRKRKLSYVLGILLGAVFLGGGVVLGYSIMEKINGISIDSILNNSNLVRPYVISKDKQDYIGGKKIPFIGPIQFRFGLNTSLFTKQVVPTINGKVNNLKFLCGNGKELLIKKNSDAFQGVCFFRNKIANGYPLSLRVGYIDKNTSEQLYKTISAGKITIHSDIKIRNSKGELLNSGDEPQIQGGKAGETLTFDASNVFKELGVKNYKISWDLNGDGSIDRENESEVSFRYLTAGVYNISVRIPDLSDYLYSFPIRIEQSELPVGDLEYRKLGANNYNFSIKFFDTTKTVTKYVFQVLDSDKNILYRKNSTLNDFSYIFNKPGTYIVKSSFVTQDGKQGSLVSQPIVIQDKNFNFDFTVSSKLYDENSFKQIALVKKSDTLSLLTLKDIPGIVKININSESIIKKGYILTAKEQGSPLVFIDNSLSLDITSDTARTITIIATDQETKNSIEHKIYITVEREGVEGKLIVHPDTVGTSPFSVKFDASTSKVNDPDDEIVYFTWDFGDGTEKKNISEAIVEHIYYYDIKNNIGEYHPTLTIKTKKGKEYIIGKDIIILVKQAIDALNITMESHPGQVAEVGDIVSFSLELDGLPKSIKWDFGNNTFQECRSRECTSTKRMYADPGEYKIKVYVEYENRIPLEGDITLLVK